MTWYIAGAAVFTLSSFVYYPPFWLRDLLGRTRETRPRPAC